MSDWADILVIDDNPADAELMTEFLAQSGVRRVQAVSEGAQALLLLRSAARGEGKLPHVILLDLNMPRLDGRALLGKLKGDSQLHSIPVVVFTTSRSPRDIARCYELGANSVVSKPSNLHEFESALRIMKEFWLQLASLPGRSIDEQ